MEEKNAALLTDTIYQSFFFIHNYRARPLTFPNFPNNCYLKTPYPNTNSGLFAVFLVRPRVLAYRYGDGRRRWAKKVLIVAKELKRLRSDPVRVDRFIRTHVSRLLKSDLVSVLAEFQRQDQIFLCMKLYDVVRKEIWYRPDMYFYRDMLMTLARNKKVNDAKRVWADLKSEEVLFDQHTFGDIIRSFLESGLLSEAMYIYEEMRQSPEPPISLPFRVILKGLLPYPELREKVKDDFLELFPDMIVYDPPEDLFDDQERGESEDD
ncbi:Pentatricopeptide repeat-containing protein [Quillaja saponaria]|uniref:Pentatricopeptide repeat-containing protein n=1 Tax=Quillaja saponaria TaxID=32244 RepID=A0AAD7PS76_QUISA|nr:Pentatricopeptide repeat-containing protein [Quillaja saponaria]